MEGSHFRGYNLGKHLDLIVGLKTGEMLDRRDAQHLRNIYQSGIRRSYRSNLDMDRIQRADSRNVKRSSTRPLSRPASNSNIGKYY